MTIKNVLNVKQPLTPKGIFFTIFSLSILIVFASCRDDDYDSGPFPKPEFATFETSNYSLLKPGNYWVYQRYTISQDGTSSSNSSLDSTFIDGDTLINNEIFTKLNVEKFNQRSMVYLRDSADYIIDEKGKRLLGLNNFGELLYNSENDIFRSDYYMVGFRRLTTELNDFEEALKKEGQISFQDPDQYPDCGRFVTEFWVKDIGMIRGEEFYAGGCTRVRRDLIRYRVE